MKKIYLFLSMLILTNLSFSEDSVIRKISVTGNVEKEIMPDTANISFRILTKNKNLKIAGEENAKILEKFKEDLKNKGISFTKLETRNYFSQKSYEYDNNNKVETKTSYRSTLGFEISVDSFENITKLIEWAQKNNIKSIKRNYDGKNTYYLEIVKDGNTKDISYNNSLNAFENMKNELLSLNINENDIYLQSYSNQKIDTPVNDNRQLEINYVYNDFFIEIKDLKHLNDLLDIAENDNVSIQGSIFFDISNRESIESELYRDAYEQAKRKGQSILKSSELTLSDPLVVSESISYQYKAMGEVQDFQNKNVGYKEIYVKNDEKSMPIMPIVTSSSKKKKSKIDYKPQALKITKDISVLFEMTSK